MELKYFPNYPKLPKKKKNLRFSSLSSLDFSYEITPKYTNNILETTSGANDLANGSNLPSMIQ